jgi:hypothetical protein
MSVLFVFLVVVMWVGICRVLRRKRLHLISSLDPVGDALAVCRMTYFVEFPLLSKKALEFALFKTFAIPTISKVLAATRQFSPPNVTKRYDDTHIIVEELLLSHVDSPRGSLALRRLNFIHSHYNISNGDYLYTLSTFILEPKRFASRFGYRNWTEKETTANFVMWRSIGIRMGIKDIPETVEEMERFSLQYEADNMVYAHSNRRVGDATLDLLLSIVPACLRGTARFIVYCVLEERLIDAMGYPRLPCWFISMMTGILHLCLGTFVGWFLPPRPLTWSTERISMEVEDKEEEKEREKVHKLRYSEYKPESYPNGYRMDGLGYAPIGQLGTAFGGDIPCPFLSSFSNNKKVD